MAQLFPNPATLSTGQGAPGTLDPIWTVSQWYSTNPPNPMGLTYTPALINNNCAPGSWVNPAALPPPVNNGNWITGTNSPCAGNVLDGYLYFRLTLDLPADCNGNSVANSGTYTLYFQGYVDNTITDIFVNGNSTGINGGSFSSPLNITLPGPWQVGLNYVDVLVYNFPNGGQSNPYGLLLVANSQASTVADSDNDGVPDINDQCPCTAGTLANGCVDVVISGDSILCAGESTTLTSTGAGNFLWSTGATTNTITITPGGNTRYSVTVTASNGYIDSAAVNVSVNTLPVVSINPATANICAGEAASLTASGASNYVWNNAATTNIISVSPNTTTAYNVTGTDANGCTATANSSVNINQLPVASISPSSTAVCAGDSATLTAGGGTGYAWNNSATTAAITVTPAINTTYDVTVTDVNNCTATASATVAVNQLPIVSIIPALDSICEGEGSTLTASGGTGYTWSNSNSGASITVTPATDAIYDVTVTDANSCSATASATVIVSIVPIATITPTEDTICLGESTTLTASGGSFYGWSSGTTNATITESPVLTATYTVTVSEPSGCQTTAMATVSVIPAMVVSASATNISCNAANDGAINLTVTNGQQPYSYVWNTLATTEDPTGMAAGNYTVTITDNAACTATATADITEPTPLSVLSSPINPSCVSNGNDGSIELNVSGGTTPYYFNWTHGAGSANLQQLAPGTYSVIVRDANNCSASESFTLAYLYDFTVVATPDVTLNLGQSTTLGYTLTGNAGNYVALWSPATQLSCNNCAAPIAAGNVTTTYTIEISNDAGCTARDFVKVSVIPDYSVFVPSAFTPNGDGTNDVFSIYSNSSIALLNIQIFNRIGEKVFETDDLNFAWDGTYKGRELAPSVLTWQMRVSFIDGHSEELRKGTITLIR